MPILRLILALLTLAASSPARAQQADSPQEEQATFRVDVKLVNVFVTVVDPQGAPVAGLAGDNFQITEDGIAQKVRVFARESELPLSIVLAVDASLSTRKDLKLELESARRFIHSTMRPQDALALYQFAETVSELVRFTSDLKTIDRGIGRVHVGSATALYDAIYLGSEALQARRGRKVMVVITDGGDTLSRVSYAEALRAAQQSEAILYSIIIVPIASSAGRNTGGEHALIQLSTDTGGKHYYAEGTRDLDRVFRQISDQLRTQYLLAYYPQKRLSDSSFRRIEVQLKPAGAGDPLTAELPELRARHRTGYYTTKDK